MTSRHWRTDILVVGGGLGGVSATLAAARLGCRVALVEELDWLGGQLTAQGVPFDEHPWIETGAGSSSYARFRAAIRKYYLRHFPLTADARARHLFNPGMGNVGTLCHEPRVAVRVIDDLLLALESAGRLKVLRRHAVVSVSANADRIEGVVMRNLDNGTTLEIEGAIIIDATETGELLRTANIEHVIGAEAASETRELHALPQADPMDQQALTWCFALDYRPDEDHTVDEPARYAAFRDLKLDFWPNRQFDWTVSNHVTHKPLKRALFAGDSDAEYVFDLWHARRIAYRHNFVPGAFDSDITLANWPQMDYWLKPVLGVPDEDRDHALEDARQFSLSFLYWMQTEAPRHDGGQGYRGLRLRGDVLGTSDGLAKQAYYRESRRIRAEFTVLEQHIGVAARSGASQAESFFDSVGIGAYRIDLHPSTSRTRDTVDIDSYPFEIPLGALLPVRMENLLAACKNIGTTRITSGAYRVHPVEWSIGEAAGTVAALSLKHGVPPRAIRSDAAKLAALQSLLEDSGAPIRWPRYDALTPYSRRGYRPPPTL